MSCISRYSALFMRTFATYEGKCNCTIMFFFISVCSVPPLDSGSPLNSPHQSTRWLLHTTTTTSSTTHHTHTTTRHHINTPQPNGK